MSQYVTCIKRYYPDGCYAGVITCDSICAQNLKYRTLPDAQQRLTSIKQWSLLNSFRTGQGHCEPVERLGALQTLVKDFTVTL